MLRSTLLLFLVCLINCLNYSADPVYKYPKKYNFYAPIPMIGQYGDPYNFFSKSVLGLDPELLNQFVPDILKTNKTYRAIFPKRKNYAQVVFYFQEAQQLSVQKPFNLIFHPFAGINMPYYFNKNIDAGIFNAMGIANISLPVDTFGKVHISVHNGGGLHFSPNNAQFKLLPNRSIASFWSYAYDNQNGTLTLHIILTPRTSNDLANYLINELRGKPATCPDICPQPTLKRLLLNTAPYNIENKTFAKNDVTTWKNIYNTLVNIFQEEQFFRQLLQSDFNELITLLTQINTLLP